jgi:hypothetical protein
VVQVAQDHQWFQQAAEVAVAQLLLVSWPPVYVHLQVMVVLEGQLVYQVLLPHMEEAVEVAHNLVQFVVLVMVVLVAEAMEVPLVQMFVHSMALLIVVVEAVEIRIILRVEDHLVAQASF